MITVTDSTRLMRGTVRATWPDVRFSIRAGRGASTYAAVAWIDGPTVPQVYDRLRPYTHSPDNGARRNYLCANVLPDRRYSDAAVTAMIRRLQHRNPGHPQLADLDPVEITATDIHYGRLHTPADPDHNVHLDDHLVTTGSQTTVGRIVESALRMSDLTPGRNDR
ncbi:LPD29 domain-containing protein [uncultured Williamsia sp.]|uniref:LPD29 domain-containing protein n=1 Tax=uncultured Williamsia sp. TaxID=259311 RepID=UPI00261A6C0C|nr:LPD29 domain-containing protein [uncultured Williamsia sp.]